MKTCPVCSSTAETQHPGTPYWECPVCDLWFQDTMPQKLWHGPHEAPPDAMGDAEKSANEHLSAFLCKRLAMAGGSKTLDVGSAFPWLARSFKVAGMQAWGIEPGSGAQEWHRELCVSHIADDFESWSPIGAIDAFSLITFIHSFEHCYDPQAAFVKAAYLLAKDGHLFIRMPDHRVPGYERDLTDGHYTIHPYFHTLTSILQLCAETGCFEVVEDWPLTPGQRDLLLRPL